MLLYVLYSSTLILTRLCAGFVSLPLVTGTGAAKMLFEGFSHVWQRTGDGQLAATWR